MKATAVTATATRVLHHTSAPAQVWADVDPAEGYSIWFHPAFWGGTPETTTSREKAVQWARETGRKPAHRWILS